jgi:hypothetical protein
MITQTEYGLKVEALDYAVKRKIVNEKTIEAYINAYKSCESKFTVEVMLNYIRNVWNHSQETIEREVSTHYAYSGYESSKREQIMMEKQLEISKKIGEALEIFKTI